MEYRKLGNCDTDISVLGIGGMAMTNIYGKADTNETINAIHAALDAGINFIDTSDAYASGKNEEMIGEALRNRRNQAFVATKFGNLGGSANGRPEYVIQACEKSLQRLKTDVIDLYLQHRVDPDVPIEETVGSMARLVEQGKVRYLGLSEAGLDTIERAHKTYPITALQTEYSLWTRFVEKDHLPLLRKLDIGFIAYSPLGRGMLTGTISGQSSLNDGDRRFDHPRFGAENIEKNVDLISPFFDLANKKRVTSSQLALAWLMAQGDDIFPIPGTKSMHHLLENINAIDIKLTAEEVDEISNSFDPNSVFGTRYPTKQLGGLGI